jgi:S-(2-succino)cysteine N-acetyltransferase
MSQLFREVEIEDAEKYRRFIAEAYKSNEEYKIHFGAATATLEAIVRHITQNKVYVLEENGTFVSSVSIRLPWGPNPGPLGLPHIGWFSTNPAYKRQGMGKKMYNWLEEEILKKQFKLPAVTLGTADNHPWLKEMYEQMGFGVIGTKDLGLDHLTIYFLKVLQPEQYQLWKKTHPTTIGE